MAAFGGKLIAAPLVDQSATPTLAVVTNAAVPTSVGAYVIVILFWWSGGGQPAFTSVSGGGLTWTTNVSPVNGSMTMAIASAPAPSGLASSTSLTVTFAGNTVAPAIMVDCLYITGAGSVIGGSSGTAGSGTTWTGGSLSLSTNDIIVGAGFEDGSGAGTNGTTATPDAGYTEASDFLSSTNTEKFETVYQVAGSGGSYTPGGTFTGGTGTVSVGGAVAFVDSGGAAAVVPAAPPHRMPLGV